MIQCSYWLIILTLASKVQYSYYIAQYFIIWRVADSWYINPSN